MRLIILLPCSVSLAFRISSPDGKPVRKAYGPENRHCHVGEKVKDDTGTSPTIIGGSFVEDPNSFPFLAWLGDNDGTGMAQFCGGSLIHPRIVMTAAHCVYPPSLDEKMARVYARFHLTNFAKAKGSAHDIINWKVHEGYSRKFLTNDIALMLLAENATSDKVYPVDLSDGGETDDHDTATIVGWGSTDEDCRQYDTFLREAIVPIGPKGNQCSTPGSKVLSTADMDPHKQICAGFYEQDGMQYPGCGDSGGPLLVKNDAKKGRSPYTQVGFVSWSYGVPFPDVFTRVSHFRSWIDENIQALLQEGAHPVVQQLRKKAPAEAKASDEAQTDEAADVPHGADVVPAVGTK